MHLDLNIENIRLKLDGGPQQVSRFESASIMVACGVALIWLASMQSHPFLIFGPAALFLKLAPVWNQVYWPFVLLIAAEIVRAGVNLVRPDWTRFRAIGQIAIHIGGLAVAYVVLRAGAWVAVADPAGSHTNEYSRVVDIINRCIHAVFSISVFISCAQLLVRIVRLIRQPRQQPKQEASPAA